MPPKLQGLLASMKHVKIAIFSITFIFLPRIFEALHIGTMLAYGAGTFVALAAYLIPSKDDTPFPLRKWLFFAIPASFLVALIFGKLWPR
jgi:uncharacterized membrane protein YagU involved in acid resistance